NSGSIFISTLGIALPRGKNGIGASNTLHNIENPYEVFKFIKKVSHDIKTDIEYPNELRPKNNPGYNTDYKSPKS
ncbi:hypothetical protein KC717_06675, partial [Candidatus Dojkabacteria bacterium]|nr:hypothetical protein [Candidatus Dojkabacteria bacterium]